jgi:hypothetical protein
MFLYAPARIHQVVVTGAAGNIGYAILFMVAAGRMAGHDQPLELRLLDLPNMEGVLKGVVMELHDCAFPLVTSVIATSDYKTVRACAGRGRRFFFSFLVGADFSSIACFRFLCLHGQIFVFIFQFAQIFRMLELFSRADAFLCL